MGYSKQSGFIIKRKNFSEADRLITLFTKKKGKIRVLAKGVRKVTSRRAPHLELFNKVKISCYQGKTFAYLTEVQVYNNFPNLRKNLACIAVAYQMCELTDKFSPEEQENKNIYELLEKGLKYLNCLKGEIKKEKIKEISRRFTLRLLSLSGFIGQDTNIDPKEYAQIILERKLSSPGFISGVS